MRKILTALIICSMSFLFAGCQDEYFKQLDELKARADSLQVICDKLNGNVLAMSKIVKALESYDFITGVTSVTSEGKETGYRINFVKNGSITITNGISGTAPLIGTRKDSDGRQYWTIQYGTETPVWMLDSKGNKIPSVGYVPKFEIRDGKWYVSYDMSTWTELGVAEGGTGDGMFKDIIVEAEYVLFILADGTEYKIPTFKAYSDALNDINSINSNALALKTAVDALLDGLVYITDVSCDSVSVGVALSNGKSFRIYDWAGTNVPNIFFREDAQDGIYYWAVQYGEESPEWILDREGNRIQAMGAVVEIPAVDIAQAADGYYYWTVTYANDTTVWLGLDEGVHAVDSVKNTIFLDVVETETDLTLTLLDGTEYSLPKEFSVKMEMSDTLHVFSNDTLYMSAGAKRDTAFVKYTAYGVKVSDVVLFTQAGFDAVDEGGVVRIVAPEDFADGEGKLTALFSFEDGVRSVVKEIIFARTEEAEIIVEPEQED